MVLGQGPSATLVSATIANREASGNVPAITQVQATRTQYSEKSHFVATLGGLGAAWTKKRRYCVGLMDALKHVGQISKLPNRESLIVSQSVCPSECSARGQLVKAGSGISSASADASCDEGLKLAMSARIQMWNSVMLKLTRYIPSLGQREAVEAKPCAINKGTSL